MYDSRYGSLKLLDSDAVDINSTLEHSFTAVNQCTVEQNALGVANPASERATNLVHVALAVIIRAVLREKYRSNVQ